MALWQKLLAFFPLLAKGNSGAGPSVDWTKGTTQSMTLNAATVTPTFVAPPAGTDLRLLLIQDGTGGRVVVWPVSVTWIGGAPPTLFSAAGAVSEVLFYFDGTTYFGSVVSASSGAVTEVRFAIGTGATQTSATAIPANAIVIDAELDIVTPYTAGTTIEVGSATSLALLQSTTDNVATSSGLYAEHQDTAWGGAGSKVTVTVAGAPVAGAGFCIVRYVDTPQP